MYEIECGQWEYMTVDALEGTKGKMRKENERRVVLYYIHLLYYSIPPGKVAILHGWGCDVEIQIQYFLCQILISRTMNDEQPKRSTSSHGR